MVSAVRVAKEQHRCQVLMVGCLLLYGAVHEKLHADQMLIWPSVSASEQAFQAQQGNSLHWILDAQGRVQNSQGGEGGCSLIV
jgi:hypothetical protein